jgi:hypothetical protein
MRFSMTRPSTRPLPKQAPAQVALASLAQAWQAAEQSAEPRGATLSRRPDSELAARGRDARGSAR